MAETLRWQQIWKNHDWAIESVDVFCSMETFELWEEGKGQSSQGRFCSKAPSHAQ